MRLLNLAATSSLAALVLTLGVGQLQADHDGWSGSQRGLNNMAPRQNTQPSWWQRQPAPRYQQPSYQQPYQQPRYQQPRYQAQPGNRNNGFFGWFEPQPDLPRWQNAEPEAPPAKAPVIYTYRADPLVDLADADLTRPENQSMRWRPASQPSQAVFEALKTGSSGVRVTEQQRDDIIAFYRERDFAPVWVSDSGQSARVDDLLDELADAESHGLEPQDYVPSGLGGFSDDLSGLDGDREGLARIELALTAAALRYAVHASGGRIVPERLSAYHDLTPPTVDGQQALTRLAEEPSPGAYLASLHPVHPAYEAMRQELADLSAQPDRDEAPIAEGPAIKPGGTDARMPEIRKRLIELGHLSPADAAGEVVASPIDSESVVDSGVPLFGSPDSSLIIEVAMPEEASPEPGMPEPELRDAEPDDSLAYDAEMVEALKAFQEAAGLTVDGIIGQRTIAAFNAENTENRIRQLAYNMERLRWLPRDFGPKHVLVNTASFETQVVENGETIWRSKVIVGKPQTQTVFFSDQMETVVFNPYWGVPKSIIVNEMLPEIYKDPYYMEREGYEVTDLNGRVIPSHSVDWYNLNTDKLPIGVRQPPGPDNALGEIKFLFPNEHAIYMHDTPTKPLFEKPMRAYSHGCVRVQNPRDFAEIILGWDQQRIASTLATSRDLSVPVEDEIKVHVTYFTAWPDETGTIRYYEDVYGRDRLLEEAVGTLTVAMR